MHDSQDEAKIQESLNRFIGYCQSPEFVLRNLVGSTALETLPIVASSPKDVATVLELLSTVAVDRDVDVRCNVVEYIVHIALMLSDPNKSCETLRSFITSHLLPIIVTALLDSHPKVVKIADCSLIALLEHCLVSNGYVQEWIWPAIIKKMYNHPRVESMVRVITLMSKMVPWVGCDTTETLFVPLFLQLCSSPEIMARKACASIIGDFCAVVSLNTVETQLVPSFLALCGDTLWVVRKACACVVTSVSSAASTYTRRRHLTPAFAALLTDPVYYVRSAAFQSLGPFITTFAEPSITNLGYNHQGKLVLKHPDGFEFQLNDIELNMTDQMSVDSSVGYIVYTGCGLKSEEDDEDDVKTELLETDKKTNLSNLDDKLQMESAVEETLEDNKQQYTRLDDNKCQGADESSDGSFACDQNEVFTLEQSEDSAQDPKNESGLEWNSETLDTISLDDNNLDSGKEILKTDSEVESINVDDSAEVRVNNDVESTEKESGSNEEEKKDKDKAFELDLNDEEKEFNGFLFWQDPIPDIEIDILKETPSSSSFPKIDTTKKKRLFKYKSSSLKDEAMFWHSAPPATADPSSSIIFACFQKMKTSSDPAKLHYLDGNGNDCEGEGSDSLVPNELISHFVSMSHPRQDKMQHELAHHCAYNLPAVALTLGPENWILIKQACNALATDQQWRVRKIVASSIHELAVIVGSDVAMEDLVPLFTGFIKDLDEVRIGALKHLANFLKLLKPAGRNSFLPRLAEFLITDYEWNWRFRAELAEQLLQIVRLFTPQDISVHVAPVAFTLLQDKVAYVRNIALQLVVEVISVIAKVGVLVRSAVAELAEQFAHSSRWSRRQTFAHLCSELVVEEALPIEMFARDILPHLLDLSWDKVPNVRLSVANTLSRHIMALDTFANPLSPHHEVVMIVLKRLQSDKDRDVRYFASLPSFVSSETTVTPTPAQLPESSTVDSNKVTEAQEDTLR